MSRKNSGTTNSDMSFEKISAPSERDSPAPSEVPDQPSEEIVDQPSEKIPDQPSEEIEILPTEDDVLVVPAAKGESEPEELDAGSAAAAPPPTHINRMDPVVKELEEAAAVATAAATEAAAAAKAQIVKGATSAKAFMSSLWSAFDDTNAAARHLQTESDLRKRLSLTDDEAILEVFRCKLIQSYAPNSNDFTPPKNIAFTGQLHVTSGHICFELDGAGGAGPPIVIPKEQLKGVVREGDDVLRIALVDGKEMVIGAFSLPKFEVESCFSLLASLSSDEQ